MRFELSQEIVSCLKVIGDILNEATFLFHEEGLRIYEMTKDQTNIVMFDYKFKCDLEDKFAVDMNKLMKVLRIPKENDSVFFTIEKAEGDIKIEIRSEGFEREFFVKKLVTETDVYVPSDENNMKLTFTTKFNVSKPMFNRIIDEALMFNSFCCVSTTEEGGKATLLAEDDAGKGYKSEFDADFIEVKSARARYDLDKFKKIMKADTEKLEISMRDNYPLKMFFCGENYDFTFIIAPLCD